MGNSNSLSAMRANYCSLWDAHQVIADANVRLLKAGKQPSDEQLKNEKRAAEAVQTARKQLLALMAAS
jgi:hypothetical protein